MWPQFLSAAEQTVADKGRLSTLALNSRSESLASVSRRRGTDLGLWGWWGGCWGGRLGFSTVVWQSQRSLSNGAALSFSECSCSLSSVEAKLFFFFFLFPGLIGARQVDRAARVIDQKFFFLFIGPHRLLRGMAADFSFFEDTVAISPQKLAAAVDTLISTHCEIASDAK